MGGLCIISSKYAVYVVLSVSGDFALQLIEEYNSVNPVIH